MKVQARLGRRAPLCAWISAGALLVGLSPVRGSMPEKSREPRWAPAWGKPVHGVQVGIQLVTPVVNGRAPQRVHVRFLVRNTTDQPIDFAYGNAQRIYGWEVGRQADGVWVVEPRWRHWREEKLEPLIAGAMSMSIPAMGEAPLPLEGPKLLVSHGAAHDRLTIVAKRGEHIRLKGAPITAAAKGEEWLDSLETGVVTIESRSTFEPAVR